MDKSDANTDGGTYVERAGTGGWGSQYNNNKSHRPYTFTGTDFRCFRRVDRTGSADPGGEYDRHACTYAVRGTFTGNRSRTAPTRPFVRFGPASYALQSSKNYSTHGLSIFTCLAARYHIRLTTAKNPELHEKFPD